MPAPAPSRRGLARGSRLKHGRDFARLRQAGQRLAHGCLIANWLPLPPESRSRLGVVVGGKVGGAVVRNRVKRLLRESFRGHQTEFAQPLDLVLVARPSIVGREFRAVENDFLGVLRRAGLLQSPSPTAPPNDIPATA